MARKKTKETNPNDQDGSTIGKFTLDVESMQVVRFECVAADQGEAEALAEMIYPGGNVKSIRSGFDSKRCPICGGDCEDACTSEMAAGLDDRRLSKEEIEKKYGYWDEHPTYTFNEWKMAVCNGETRSSYWQWVVTQIGEA